MAARISVGDAVFGVCEVNTEAAYAEKVAIRSAIVARKPESLSHTECAALALIGLTALVSIEDTWGGDVITAIDGEPVHQSGDLLLLLEQHEPGDRVRVTIARGGKEQDVRVTLQPPEED